MDLRILGNETKISKLSDSPPEFSFWRQRSKHMQKQTPKYSGLVQFYFIFLLLAKYFITQSSSNLNILSFVITLKALLNFQWKYKQNELRKSFELYGFLQALFHKLAVNMSAVFWLCLFIIKQYLISSIVISVSLVKFLTSELSHEFPNGSQDIRK